MIGDVCVLLGDIVCGDLDGVVVIFVDCEDEVLDVVEMIDVVEMCICDVIVGGLCFDEVCK